MDALHCTPPDPLLAVRLLIKDATPEEAALLGALAASAVSQALALRRLPVAAEASDGPQYVPHALDVLIVASIQLDKAQTRNQLIGVIEGQTYQSKGKSKVATPSTIKRRIEHLAKTGLLVSTRSGYAIGDESAVEELEKLDFE